MTHETEAGFTMAVIDLATLCGWLVHHSRPARTAKGWRTPIMGNVGLPDLVMVHAERRRCIVAELKVGRNKPTADQTKWLAAFATCGVQSVVWKPENWEAIREALESPAGT